MSKKNRFAKKTSLGVTVRVDGLIEMFGLTRMRQTAVVIVVVKSCASLVDELHRGERRLSQQKAARLISARRKEDRRGGRGTRSSAGEFIRH